MLRVKNIIIDRARDPLFSAIEGIYSQNMKVGNDRTRSDGKRYVEDSLIFQTEEEAMEAEENIKKLWNY